MKNRSGYLKDENGNEYVQVCILKEKIRELKSQLADVVEVLKRIQSTAGHPDAADGCRIIIKLADVFLKRWGIIG